jgi:hypothetical protein
MNAWKLDTGFFFVGNKKVFSVTFSGTEPDRKFTLKKDLLIQEPLIPSPKIDLLIIYTLFNL